MLNLIKEGWTQTSAPEKSANQNPSVSTTNLPESSAKRLTDKHFAHCCGSDTSQKERGLNPDWIAANCYSVDIKQASQLLGYPARSGGIVISGSNGQFQFRPDKPWSDQQGKKAAKYRTALRDEYDALLPAHPTDKHYWHNLEALKQHCWHIDGHPYLIITEGGFKAICACIQGLPTIALLGVEMGLTSAKTDPQGKRYLVPSLERLVKAGFGFLLAFDADISVKEAVKKALYKLGFQLNLFNAPVYVLPEWDEQLGKGLDDYLQMNGIEAFRQQLLAQARSLDDWSVKYFPLEQQQKLTATQKAWRCLQETFGERIRYNELKLTIELDGEPADLEQLYLDLELDHNTPLSKDRAIDLAVRLARRNAYHPVKEYLNHVAETVTPISLDDLSRRYFGTHNPIYDEIFKRHLIGSVARIFNSGCKKDEVLVLKGLQGIGKSTFLNLLYGDEFFSDSVKGTDRDNLLVLHQYWCLELAEIETITGKREAGELKGFITSRIDTFREPYARSSKPRKRSSVLVATVNPDTFLVDPTGNRRYWVIEVAKNFLDWELIAQERDAIWASAVMAYRNGESWHLATSQAQQVNDLNNNYIHEDTWTIKIADYLEARQMTTTMEVLLNALDFEPRQVSKREEMRVANVLKNLGFSQTRATYLGKRQRVWMKNDPGQPLAPRTTPPLEVVQSESVSGQDFGRPGQPGQPLNQNNHQSNKHPLSPTDVAQGEPKDSLEVVQLVPNRETQSGVGGQLDGQPRTTILEVVPTDEVQGVNEKKASAMAQPTISHDEVDYSTYPHRTSNDIRAKEKRANKCKELMLACTTSYELAKFKSESDFSSNEINWVFHHALTPSEREKVMEAAKADQLNLLEQSIYTWNELIAAIDEELIRLGWSVEQAKKYVWSTYGVKARRFLDDQQIIEFWQYLKRQ
jgi:predicted P-loop ATPase